MQLKIPIISDHAVSPSSGFLPPDPPLRTLPPQYDAWDHLASTLPQAISSKTLRAAIASLPILSADGLRTPEHLHRAFVVLGFLIHGYVLCDGSDHPEPNVPAQLAEPYLDVCERLGMQTTLSYAGLCLWNWQIKREHEIVGSQSNGIVNGSVNSGLKNLDDLDCLVSFTGTRDEAVFYLVPVMVEAEGGRLVGLLLHAMENALLGDKEDSIVQVLEQTRDTLPRLTALIKLLHERCDPKVFYEEVRPFYPGAKGMEDRGMPDGVIFKRSDGTKVNSKCVGGSAAQSSYFQFIDLALGVKHRPVGEAQGETVFQEMWSYMPSEHREFLTRIEQLPSLREYVVGKSGDRRLTDAYNGCLQQLASWRSRHIGVVTTHIVTPSRNTKPKGEKPAPEEVTDGLSVKDESALKGTGGSALIPFLKQAKQETMETCT